MTAALSRSASGRLKTLLLFGRRSARGAIDLADGAHVVCQVPNGADHPAELRVVHFARRPQSLAESIGLATQFLTQRTPLSVGDGWFSPTRRPVGAFPWFPRAGQPPVQQRQTVSHVVDVSGNGSAARARGRCRRGRQLI